MVLLRSIVLCAFLIICQNVYAAAGSGFCYKEGEYCSPSHWDGVCQTGNHQSPIDIELNVIIMLLPTSTDLFLSSCYSDHQDFIVKNNGHTVQVNLEADQTSRCTLAGDLVKHSYTFAQFHFHWGPNDQGSEHSVNNFKYAMEGHLVHYRSDFDNVTQAIESQEPDALAVLAVMFMLHDNDEDNAALEPIIDAIESVRSAGTETKGSGLVLSDFLNLNTRRFVPVVQYFGSLTTPDCSESVLWNVFTGPKFISHRQLNLLRSINDVSGEPLTENFRPIQPLNDRKIRYYRTSIQTQGD